MAVPSYDLRAIVTQVLNSFLNVILNWHLYQTSSPPPLKSVIKLDFLIYVQVLTFWKKVKQHSEACFFHFHVSIACENSTQS